MGDGSSSGDDGKLSEIFAMVKRYEPGQLVETVKKQLGAVTDSNEEKQLAAVNGSNEAAPVSGVNVTPPIKDPLKKKKNPLRKEEEKTFNKHYHAAPRDAPKDNAVIGNITKLLPANTFLMFQTLAPLATNQGNCGQSEYVMTTVMLLVLGCACGLICFTDTFQHNGKVYHGVVTGSGLWNPSFKGDPAFNELRVYEHQLAKFYQDRQLYKLQKKDHTRTTKPVRPVQPEKPKGPLVIGPIYHSGTKQFCLKFTDFLHVVVTITAFATFTLLTSPVTNCFYPHISTAIVKTTPLLVGFVASAIFAFSPPARNGLAHPLPPGKLAITSTIPGNPGAPDPTGKTGGATPVGGAQPPPPPTGGGDSKGMLGQMESKVMGSSFVQNALNQVEAKVSNVSFKTQNGLNKFAQMMSMSLLEVAQLNLPPGIEAIVEMGEAAVHDMGSGAMTTANSSAPAPQGLMPQANKFSAMEANALYQPAINSAQQSTQLSGLRQTLTSVGADAASWGAHALAAGQARAQEGFQLPGSPAPYLAEQLLRQQALLGSQGLINQNLIQANVLARDGSVLYGQGLQSSQHIQNQLWQQGSAVEQGLNSQVQLMKQPASQVAHGLTSLFSNGSHLLNEVPSILTHGHLANTVAREVGTLLVEGSKHGVVGVTDELRRQRDVLAQDLNARFQQSIQPLAEGMKSLEQQGSQSLNGAQDELLKSKAALQQGLNTQLQALRQPSSSLAQEITSTFQQGSQNLYQNLYQPASSVAIDIPSLAQQGSQAFNDVRSQLQGQEAATAQGLNGQFQNLYQPTSSAANDALSVYRQNMAGARSLATGLTQDPQALERHLAMLAQAGPVAQFQQTVGQIRPDLQSPGAGSRSSPGQQLSAAFVQAETGSSGLLSRASQSVSTIASNTGDQVARSTQTYIQEGLKEGVNNVVQISTQTANLSTPAEIRELSSSVDPEIRESSTQVAERVLRGVLASTSQTAEAAAEREVGKGKSRVQSEISADLRIEEITSVETADVSAGPLKVHVELQKSS